MFCPILKKLMNRTKLISHHGNNDCSRLIQNNLPYIARIVKISTITSPLPIVVIANT